MSVARRADFGKPGSKPVELKVKLGALTEQGPDVLSEGLKDLYRRGEFTDTILIVPDALHRQQDHQYLAHRIVLAAQSSVFKSGFAKAGNPPAGQRNEIRMADVTNPEAVKIMLDFLYQIDSDDSWNKFHVMTQEINRDVLRLAKQFGLPALTHKAMHWLSKELTTGNVVERLEICTEFDLGELKTKILEALTNNRLALAEVANSPQIMQYPGLMQALLQSAASSTGSEPEEKPKAKKARKG